MAPRDHPGQRGPAELHDGRDVDVELALQVGGLGVEELAGEREARVVDEQVDGGGREPRGDAVAVGGPDRSAASTSTATPRRGRARVEAVPVAGDDHQVTAVGGQAFDERGADTGRGAGDQSGGHDADRRTRRAPEQPRPTARRPPLATAGITQDPPGVRVLALLERGGHLGEVGEQLLEAVGGGVDRRGGEHPGLLGPEQLDVVAHGVGGAGEPAGEQRAHGVGVGDEGVALADRLQVSSATSSGTGAVGSRSSTAA